MLHLVVPLWNQWPMTEAFLQSLEGAEPVGSYRLILIDNGSTDGTSAGLKAWRKRLPFTVIRNRKNLGVAPAWNQGVQAALKAQATWIGVLNNDLVLSAGCLSRLLARAKENHWALASPATREGALGYHLPTYAEKFTRRCKAWNEAGRWFGWCFLVERKVFEKVGLFDEGFKVGIGEDEDFFRRAKQAEFACGVSGGSFVHHFGSASIGPWRLINGKDFEEKNVQRLREKYAVLPQGRLSRTLKRWLDGMQRTLNFLRWGYQLKEQQ